MTATRHASRLSITDMDAILGVTRALAAPFDLRAMLEEVTRAACLVLRAERASVWLHDPHARQLYVAVARDVEQVRVDMGVGLVGACARDRAPINVPDCYADPRFNREVDARTGFHTRCSLTLPLVDHDGALVGVLQVLNRIGGTFDVDDELLAESLAAQCAVALSRVRAVEEHIATERLRGEMELASRMQRSTLPASMPTLPGYEMHGVFLPASLTGGDTFDLALIDQGLLVLLADATGHGIAPALSVTQMHAMLRMAFRMGADLETAFRHVNDQLLTVLPDSRFVTACIALLDPSTHRLRMLSGGQGPLLHYRAADRRCEAHRATWLPLGTMPIAAARPAIEIDMAPGDWLVLLSDGVYECEAPDGTMFGRQRVEQRVAAAALQSPSDLAMHLLSEVEAHRAGMAQDDDITMVLLKRSETC
ncbi:MAG: SpoIIE family protein phosphatase [Rubrivivax sp.]|nr:SpoIIE family protein phosphatase [Rubrivivax sp.]